MGSHQLDRLFQPRSVVFIGASADPGRLTGRPLRLLRRHGFGGSVHLVHPKHDEIDGVPAARTVAELSLAPDVAVVMVPAAAVVAIAEACGSKGVRHLVVLSSGFEETDGGTELAERLRAISDLYGMGIVGPNSEGLWFVPGRTILTFGSAADRDSLTAGPVAVLSQSGSIGASIIRRMNDSGVGANAFVSVGNETVLEVADYLDWLVEHGGIRVAICFLEGVRDGRRFLQSASRAREAGVAVVVLHSGESDAGRAASASHTGKISSSAAIYRTLLAQAGVLQVDSLAHLAAAASVLSGVRLEAVGGDTPGRGMTVIGLSGGSRSIIADAAAVRGLPLARLSGTTTKELAAYVPDFGAVENPVDPTGQVLSDAQLFPKTIKALAADEHTEALLVQYANGGLPLVERHLETLAAVSQSRSLPVVVSTLLDEVPAEHPVRRALAAAGITYSHDPTLAVDTLDLLFRWRRSRSLPPMLPVAAPASSRHLDGWADVAGWAAEAGVAPPREVVLPAGLSMPEVARRLGGGGLGFPLVVKPLPDDVEHKSDAGLVHLSLTTPAEVHAAAKHIVTAVPGCSRVLVQEQISTDVELLVVLELDPDFGPVMGVGPGGFFVEVVAELAYVALPASAEQIRTAIRATSAARLLSGYRGRRSADLMVVSASLARLGDAYADLADRPRLIELNPVTVEPGGDLRIVDSIVERDGPA